MVDYAYIRLYAHLHIVCDVDDDVYVGQWITLSWNFGSYMPNYLLNINIKWRSEEHTSELQSHVRISYAVFCLKKKKKRKKKKKKY